MPDDRATRDLNTDFGQMGFRVPAVSVSPYTRAPRTAKGFQVDHGIHGHESILKLISYRFGLGARPLLEQRELGFAHDQRDHDLDDRRSAGLLAGDRGLHERAHLHLVEAGLEDAEPAPTRSFRLR